LGGQGAGPQDLVVQSPVAPVDEHLLEIRPGAVEFQLGNGCIRLEAYCAAAILLDHAAHKHGIGAPRAIREAAKLVKQNPAYCHVAREPVERLRVASPEDEVVLGDLVLGERGGQHRAAYGNPFPADDADLRVGHRVRDSADPRRGGYAIRVCKSDNISARRRDSAIPGVVGAAARFGEQGDSLEPPGDLDRAIHRTVVDNDDLKGSCMWNLREERFQARGERPLGVQHRDDDGDEHRSNGTPRSVDRRQYTVSG
jgi:hypothetical protein